MGKRVNPYRRLRQKQAQLFNEQRLLQSALNGADMAKLQQGAVRSGLRENPSSKTFRAPHWTDPDIPGKRKRKLPKRFSAK